MILSGEARGFRAVVYEAPAKLNWYLSVGRRRPDGYHDVTTVLQTLAAPVDTISLSEADDLTVSCEPDPGVSPEENLAAEAIRALGSAVGREPRIAVRIEKRIPAAAGLGGASSDAAAALVGACELWGIDAASPEVAEIACSLGADVPFFLHGGAALFAGRGDVLAERLPACRMSLVLVRPEEGVPTPAAYAAFDRLPPRHGGPSLEPLITALRACDARGVARVMRNDLDEAAESIVPTVGAIKRWLSAREGVLGAILCGSGSTVAGLCSDDAVAQAVAREAEAVGWWSCATVTADAGVRRVR